MTPRDANAVAAVREESTMNEPEPDRAEPRAGRGAHAGHGRMMMICCIPMLVIAVALVATGVASGRIVFSAIACTVMMAMMSGER